MTTAQASAERTLRRFSPEMRLVLACLRWPVDADAIRNIQSAAAQAHDWEHFLAIVRRHRVAGLVAHALRLSNVTLEPAAATHLQQLAVSQTRLGLLLATETVRLQRLLRRSSIEPLFLKGATVATLAYGSLTLRHAKDIDLLVSEHEILPAMRVLRAAGYVPFTDPEALPPERLRLWLRHGKAMDWRHPASGALLELHWHITDLPAVDDDAYRTRQREVAIVPGASISALGEAHLLAYLCVHGAGHGWMRLKWLADVNAMLPKDNPAAIAAAFRAARAAGAGRATAQAILLCHDLLGLPLDSATYNELAAMPLMGAVCNAAVHLLTRGDEITEVDDLPFGSSQVVVTRFLLADSPRALAAELRTWAYRPDEFIETRLPSSLFFLFPVVRVFRWMVSRLRNRGRTAPQKT